MGCCPIMIEFLSLLGAKHASKMHFQGADDDPNHWPAGDWRLHIDEERQYVRTPIVEVHGLEVWRVLEQQHAQILGELARYGRIVSIPLVQKHSQWEEDLIREIVRVGRGS